MFPGDSVDILQERIKLAEHRAFPRALHNLVAKLLLSDQMKNQCKYEGFTYMYLMSFDANTAMVISLNVIQAHCPILLSSLWVTDGLSFCQISMPFEYDGISALFFFVLYL